MHPFVGADEFLYGLERWILYLGEAPPEEIRSMPAVKERVVAVKRYRLKSKSPSTRKLSETPARFHVTVVPKKPFLVIPEVSSEQRDYVPIAWLKPPVIPSNLVRVLPDADLWHFGVLTSSMHMAWLRQIGDGSRATTGTPSESSTIPFRGRRRMTGSARESVRWARRFSTRARSFRARRWRTYMMSMPCPGSCGRRTGARRGGG